VTEIYSDFSKPILDIVLFSRKLSQTLSLGGPFIIMWWYVLSSFIIKKITPTFGKLIA